MKSRPKKYWIFEVLYENDLLKSKHSFRVRINDGKRIESWMEVSFREPNIPALDETTIWLNKTLNVLKHKLCSLARLDPVFTKIKLIEQIKRETKSKVDPTKTVNVWKCKVQ